MTTLKNNMNKVFNEIMAMDDAQFQKELESHIDGDIATAIFEAGAAEDFISKNFFNDYLILNQVNTNSCLPSTATHNLSYNIQFQSISSDEYADAPPH